MFGLSARHVGGGKPLRWTWMLRDEELMTTSRTDDSTDGTDADQRIVGADDRQRSIVVRRTVERLDESRGYEEVRR